MTNNSSFCDTEDLRLSRPVRKPMLQDDDPIISVDFNEGREVFHEDLVETTQMGDSSPPSKRARILFKRCFEATLNPNDVPGANTILAPDSDEEDP